MAQTCCGLSARFAPTMRPAFHGRRSLIAGSNSECPISSSSWPDWPRRGSIQQGCCQMQRLRDGWLAAGPLTGRYGSVPGPDAHVGGHDTLV